MEKLLGAKSPDKAFEVQTEYAKAAYESYVSHATKLGQLYTDLARETFQVIPGFCREGDASKVIALKEAGSALHLHYPKIPNASLVVGIQSSCIGK